LVVRAGGWATLVRSWVILQRALVWVPVSGASGDVGDGGRATTISLRHATMVEVEELSGRLTLVGYHVTVLQMCTACDSQIFASIGTNQGLGQHTSCPGHGGLGGLLVGFVLSKYAAAGLSKQGMVEVKGSVDLGVGQDIGINLGCSEEVERDFSLGN
jgi:hypothetical protein